MRSVLVLDEMAVKVVFPTGSEAEVELQKAALRKAAQTFVKGALSKEAQDYLSQLTKEVKEDLKVAQKAVIQELLGYNLDHWSASVVKLPDSVKKSIKNLVQQHVGLEVKSLADQIAAERANEIIEQMLGEGRIEKYIDKLITQKVKAIAESKAEIAATQIVNVLKQSVEL